MSRPARVLFFVIATSALAATAVAQPSVIAVASPPANERGWMNTAALVEFLCIRAAKCAAPTTIKTEGAGIGVRGFAEGEAGETATTDLTLDIDGTAPAVSIDSARAATTSASSVAVIARATDAISGLMSAACNGRPAPIEENGVIRCDVPLLVGANDVVVEVSDRADNSGSAGFRIVRTASTPRLAVVPENIGMIVGQVTTVQVLDAADLNARGVAWQTTDASIGEMSTDGRHVFTAKAPGRAWLTASAGSVSARLLVSVYAGDRLPSGSTRWQIGGVMILQSPTTQPLKAGDTVSAVATNRNPGEPTTIESINRTTGWLNWRERPATHHDETVVSFREMVVGTGAVMLVDTKDGRSALVRSGSAQWRYQFPNRVRPELILSKDGGILAMETTRAGFTQLVALNGSTGHVGVRQPLPNGTYSLLNARCVKGAHGARYLPATVGPLAQLRTLTFGLVVSDDLEDFGTCGQVTGSFKRRILLATAADGENRVDVAATIEGSPATSAPEVEVFEVTIDRHGAKLLPWATRNPETGAREFRVTRFTENGQKEFKLPAVGKLWLSGREDDLAISTDGFRVVGFNVVTGAIAYAFEYEGGIRILGMDNGAAWIDHKGKEVKLAVPSGPQE
jgi:hypothetical protein